MEQIPGNQKVNLRWLTRTVYRQGERVYEHERRNPLFPDVVERGGKLLGYKAEPFVERILQQEVDGKWVDVPVVEEDNRGP